MLIFDIQVINLQYSVQVWSCLFIVLKVLVNP